MIGLTRAVAVPFALVACGAAGLLTRGPQAKEIAPFRVALAVRWGSGAGPDSFRGDLSRSLAATLAARCFAGVAVADAEAAEADVVLTVVLSEAFEETRFDDPIAGVLKPGEPAQELRRVARFQVTVDATLSARATGAVVGGRHFVANVSRRPVYIGEDPQATARMDAIERIGGDIQKGLACGSAKLGRKIADALGDADPPAALPR